MMIGSASAAAAIINPMSRASCHILYNTFAALCNNIFLVRLAARSLAQEHIFLLLQICLGVIPLCTCILVLVALCGRFLNLLMLEDEIPQEVVECVSVRVPASIELPLQVAAIGVTNSMHFQTSLPNSKSCKFRNRRALGAIDSISCHQIVKPRIGSNCKEGCSHLLCWSTVDVERLEY